MSDDQQQEDAGISEGEVIFNANLSPKTQEFGDIGDVSSASSVHENLMMKAELDSNISLKTVSSRTKSASPSSKRSSKRKRKNRRRREKKAAAATTDGTFDDGAAGVGGFADDGTGTETEFSQNSEDVKKDEETGTESETTWHDDKDFEDSSICVEPSVTGIPEEDPSSFVLQESHIPPVENNGVEENESKDEAFGNSKCGPTHSVDTLLQIAKCKIMSQILEPENENNAVKVKSDAQNDGSSNLVVPPCSPSSIHSINTTGTSREANVNSSEETQKPVIKNVHFDQRPPEVVTMAYTPSEEPSIELEPDSLESAVLDREEQIDSSKEKETIVLTDVVGNTGSATSSITSEASTASLLKGSGSSNEDFVESSYHYPSRESVDESVEQQDSNNHSELNPDTFRETIQIFKIQNPLEAQYIGNELDSILTKSLDRFTTLMESAAGGVHDNDTSPICVSGKSSESYKSQEHQESNDLHIIQIPPDDNIFEGNNDSENESLSVSKQVNPESELEVGDERISLNTTFIVEKVAEEYDSMPSPRPLSPDEMPQAIPDTVSDSDSVATTGYLSIVPEEDEDDVETNSIDNSSVSVSNLQSESIKQIEEVETHLSTPSQTFSTASCCTVIETNVSVHQKPDISEQSNEAAALTFSAADGFNNLQEQEQISTNILSSASSTKSSVSSPRSQDVNENVGAVPPVVPSSRPSTGETFECVRTESEFEMANEAGTESVEVFTLHFPSIPLAPPSENNLDSGNGDQLCLGKGNTAELMVPGIRGKGVLITSPHMRKDWNLNGRETETDSDWLPERRNSLQQVINERETAAVAATVDVKVEEVNVGSSRNNSIKGAEQQPDQKPEDLGEDEDNEQGCNCAKMCVIT